MHTVEHAAHSQWLDTSHSLVLHASSLGSLHRLPDATRLYNGAHLGVGHEPTGPQNAAHSGQPWHDAPHRKAGVKVCCPRALCLQVIESEMVNEASCVLAPNVACSPARQNALSEDEAAMCADVVGNAKQAWWSTEQTGSNHRINPNS